MQPSDQCWDSLSPSRQPVALTVFSTSTINMLSPHAVAGCPLSPSTWLEVNHSGLFLSLVSLVLSCRVCSCPRPLITRMSSFLHLPSMVRNFSHRVVSLSPWPFSLHRHSTCSPSCCSRLPSLPFHWLAVNHLGLSLSLVSLVLSCHVFSCPRPLITQMSSFLRLSSMVRIFSVRLPDFGHKITGNLLACSVPESIWKI